MLSFFLFELTGYTVFQDRLFRAGTATLFSGVLAFFFLKLAMFIGKKYNFTSDFSTNSPSILGGIAFIPTIIISVLSFSKINPYVISILFIMLSFFIVGGIDDIAKIINKRKIALGLITKKKWKEKADGISAKLRLFLYFLLSILISIFAYKFIPNLNGEINLIFFSSSKILPYLPNWAFIPLMSLIITTAANGTNFTDGLDSLASIPLLFCALFLGIISYISGNQIFANYFLIPYLYGVDELFPVCSSICGVLLAFLWYNSPPARIYMGDSGSIGLGGSIGMIFILTKAELFFPIVGLIFFLQTISVFIQIFWFKFTKLISKDKQGKRFFLKAPLHHHFQLKLKNQYSTKDRINSKITWRFHIISCFTFILGLLIFFKIR